MNLADLTGGLPGLVFLLVFFILIVSFVLIGRERGRQSLRDIPAFARLGHAIGLAVEAGQRIHLSLGRGSVLGLQSASAFAGLAMLQRIARLASVSDRPPVATSGDGALAILSQDTLRAVNQNTGAGSHYDPALGQVTGLTPFSYAAGVLPVIFDQQVSANVLAGHFGSEAALIADAGERAGGLTLAGSDNITAQAVLFAAAQEPLIGEELYAGGAYMQAGPTHIASLRAEDVLRWLVILFILGGAALKLAGVL